jgi:division protein CdvB (Snf7/Vps24/ESCRT-III family)
MNPEPMSPSRPKVSEPARQVPAELETIIDKLEGVFKLLESLENRLECLMHPEECTKEKADSRIEAPLVSHAAILRNISQQLEAVSYRIGSMNNRLEI